MGAYAIPLNGICCKPDKTGQGERLSGPAGEAEASDSAKLMRRRMAEQEEKPDGWMRGIFLRTYFENPDAESRVKYPGKKIPPARRYLGKRIPRQEDTRLEITRFQSFPAIMR